MANVTVPAALSRATSITARTGRPPKDGITMVRPAAVRRTETASAASSRQVRACQMSVASE